MLGLAVTSGYSSNPDLFLRDEIPEIQKTWNPDVSTNIIPFTCPAKGHWLGIIQLLTCSFSDIIIERWIESALTFLSFENIMSLKKAKPNSIEATMAIGQGPWRNKSVFISCWISEVNKAVDLFLKRSLDARNNGQFVKHEIFNLNQTCLSNPAYFIFDVLYQNKNCQIIWQNILFLPSQNYSVSKTRQSSFNVI